MKDVDKKYFGSNLELEARNKMKNFERAYKEKMAKLATIDTKVATKKTKRFFGFLKKGIPFKNALVDKMKTDEITMNLTPFQLSKLVMEPLKADKKKIEKEEYMSNEDEDEARLKQSSKK